MKIKKFAQFLNESIINPREIDISFVDNLYDMGVSSDVIIEQLTQNIPGVNFITYDEFEDLLKNERPDDLDTLPPEPKQPFPILFAAPYPEREEIYIIINPTALERTFNGPPPMFDGFKNHLQSILRHEDIHLQQYSRSGKDRWILPDPKDSDEYFSDKNEIMAFARSAADQLQDRYSPEEIREILKSGEAPEVEQPDFNPRRPGGILPLRQRMNLPDPGERGGRRMPPPPPPPQMGGMRMSPEEMANWNKKTHTVLDKYIEDLKGTPAYKRFMKYLYMYLEEDGIL